MTYEWTVIRVGSRIVETCQVWTSIETERAIVHGNRELIRFAAREEKVKKVIERVWEG